MREKKPPEDCSQQTTGAAFPPEWSAASDSRPRRHASWLGSTRRRISGPEPARHTCKVPSCTSVGLSSPLLSAGYLTDVAKARETARLPRWRQTPREPTPRCLRRPVRNPRRTRLRSRARLPCPAPRRTRPHSPSPTCQKARRLRKAMVEPVPRRLSRIPVSPTPRPQTCPTPSMRACPLRMQRHAPLKPKPLSIRTSHRPPRSFEVAENSACASSEKRAKPTPTARATRASMGDVQRKQTRAQTCGRMAVRLIAIVVGRIATPVFRAQLVSPMPTVRPGTAVQGAVAC